MKQIGNILWHFPFFGFVSAIGTFIIGSILVLTVVAAPIGLGLIQLSKFLFTPYTMAMVSKKDLQVEQNQAWKAYGSIVRILYFPIGLFFAVVTIFQIVGMMLSIIGIPVAIVLAKSLKTYFNPVHMTCVPSAVRDELESRKAKAKVSQYLGDQD